MGKNSEPKLFHNLIRFFLFFICFTTHVVLYAQEDNTEVQDTTQTGYVLGKILLKNPNSIVFKYTYDPDLDRYVYTASIEDYNIGYPIILTPKQYRDLIFKENMNAYFREKLDAMSGNKGEEGQKNLLPSLYINSGFFEKIFGGNTIELVPQGSVGVDLGILYQRSDNPSLSPRNRSNLSFDFGQRISLSLLGRVGKKLSINANYDTQSIFNFQNLIKLEYTPTEDDIIRKIEVGNVSMPLNSSLITGAQSLFGVKTELQFGRTRITGVFSEQRSQSRTVVAQGGGTLNEFELFALDYDEGRHFFLAHYFRDQYDTALENYPFINSQVQITRIEVWVTNRNLATDNTRNIAAIQDLGEPEPNNTRINAGAPAGFFNPGPAGLLPRNDANDFDPTQIGGTSVLTPQIRDIGTIQAGFGILSGSVNQGFDYAYIENARKLQEGVDFTLDTQLGYISLNQRLNNDEVLAVAFQYTFAGEVYQVGEFANDGVNATTADPGTNTINNNSLVLKLLKSNITNVTDPIWDLMMKNIYATGAFQLSQEDFRLNILYTDPSPVNYISPVDETIWPEGLEERILLDVFHFDRLNIYNDPQNGGDGFFDFIPGITVDSQSGRIIFTKVEPFGAYLFDTLASAGENYEDPLTYNVNQTKYVYRTMYEETKAAALEDADKNKYVLKGRYKSQGSGGIPIGAFNVPRGSVKVTAGGRLLQEGIDYTVNYQAGTVQILDEGLKASNTPIEVSVENNAIFGQQTRRFTGINVEHQFSDKFILGGTFLNLNERPLTQKSNFGTEPVNNSILGFNANYASEIPFLTRLANKLPNIQTDAPSNISIRGEFAYLLPGSPKNDNFRGETTAYLDDFEGAQTLIDIRSPLAWILASTPLEFVPGGQLYGVAPDDPDNLLNGYQRAKMAWYTIDPIFYTTQRPSELTDNDVSTNETRRIFVDEIFPRVDIAQGQTTVQSTLDIAYYPNDKGPYNNSPEADYTALPADEKWSGIMRDMNSTNFEQANVEYIQFWVLDPYANGAAGTGGELVFNLGNISEDILKDGRKQYENGLPGVNSNEFTTATSWGAVPATQSLIYAFDADENNRGLQDIGLDGLNDSEEVAIYNNNASGDPALDNYEYYLNTNGGILERYYNYNNPDGNAPVNVSNTDRGSTTLPDVEDINRDQTMNTINSYFEYRIPIQPNIQITDRYVTDIREQSVTVANNDIVNTRWIQFKIPIQNPDDVIGGISDFRSISFMRMYLTGFEENVVLRFGTLDLVRGDWRAYTESLQPEIDPIPMDDGTFVDVNTVNIQENESRAPVPYVLPPGVIREQLNNNNTIVRQNEQSLAFTVCDLEAEDSRAVFKNINIDMRQYKRLKMFLHAEAFDNNFVADNELVGFIRIGTDFSENYYQIEIPLTITPAGSSSADVIWPDANEIDVPLALLSRIKSQGIADQTLSTLTFYDENLNIIPEFNSGAPLRVGIKGNPALGNIRALMVGVKNDTGNNICGEVWFNELRLAELDNEGGWAAITAVDANIADFANISATGRISTVGFGALEQTPNERSREELKQYDVVTNVNLGQLLPKKWGVQIPLSYSHSEALITPEFDAFYQDIELKDRLDAATSDEEREIIREQSESYTKRHSINLIGLRRNRGAEEKPNFFDIENFTFNYAYNETNRRDFEIEELTEQNLRTGFLYSYNFKPVTVEPFKKSDSLFTGKYWKWLKDFNFNILPTSISLNSNITRSFHQQKFREVFTEDNGVEQLGLPILQQRNFLFDWQYTINHNLSKSLRLNFTASNSHIVRNYFEEDDMGDPLIREDLGIWDGFWDTGDANRHATQLQLNYEIPLNKIPMFSFIDASYTYTGNFDWQRGSAILEELSGEEINTIQNANTHNLTASLSMNKLYDYLGLSKKRASRNTKRNSGAKSQNTGQKNQPKAKESKVLNTLTDIVTMVKRINITYSENNGKVLPGYTESIGFVGTLRPSWSFIFGDQSDVRFEMARRGWLTQFPQFNQQYMQQHNTTLNITASVEPLKDFTIDIVTDRIYSDSYAENFRINNLGGGTFEYENLLGNRFGNFSISTLLIGTAFQTTDSDFSETFETFKENRLAIANRLALQRGINIADPTNLDDEGYPIGYGKNNQAVMLPAFTSAYAGRDANDVPLGAFRDVPIPNWTVKYTGFMRLKWFKEQFKRFSISHAYRSSYSINAFRTNLEYDPVTLDVSGNYRNPTLYTNATLVERFSPLARIDFETKGNFNFLAEIKQDRALSLSFDNNLLTEITGKEYALGLGYRLKDVRFNTNFGGKKNTLKGDLNLRADVSLRDNSTVIRNMEIDNSQITSGQTLWTLKFTADYALSKNLTTLFFYDHTFSRYAISTVFPQTSVRSGVTLRYNFGN